MSDSCCRARYNCLDLSVLASIVIGVIAGVLTFTAAITVTPAFLWVLLGVAVVYLAVILYTATGRNNPFQCAYNNLVAVLIGILGTTLFSIVLLGITFAATSVLGAVITGLLVGFFTLIITATVCLIKKVVICNG